MNLKHLVSKSGNVISRLFQIVFGTEDRVLKSILSRGSDFWTKISRVQTLQNGTVTAFPYDHRMIREAISYIKNKNRTDIAEHMCHAVRDILLEELSERAVMQNFTNPLIISIPTTRKRISHRGYNPSEMIAVALSRSMPELTYVPDVLVKTRETSSQKTLARNDRLHNVRNSMKVSNNQTRIIQNRCVIVVDDITTTGATLTEAKRALEASGARQVLCFALAH